jgi:hypothetical protein
MRLLQTRLGLMKEVKLLRKAHELFHLEQCAFQCFILWCNKFIFVLILLLLYSQII